MFALYFYKYIVLLQNKIKKRVEVLLVVRIYGISGHGKSEVDCVGSVLKIACRKAIGDEEFLHNCVTGNGLSNW